MTRAVQLGRTYPAWLKEHPVPDCHGHVRDLHLYSDGRINEVRLIKQDFPVSLRVGDRITTRDDYIVIAEPMTFADPGALAVWAMRRGETPAQGEFAQK